MRKQSSFAQPQSVNPRALVLGTAALAAVGLVTTGVVTLFSGGHQLNRPTEFQGNATVVGTQTLRINGTDIPLSGIQATPVGFEQASMKALTEIVDGHAVHCNWPVAAAKAECVLMRHSAGDDKDVSVGLIRRGLVLADTAIVPDYALVEQLLVKASGSGMHATIR